MKNHSPSPSEIVEYLDKYVIGQSAAKKSVAIALRNRWRRQNAPEELRNEIMPNNIVLIGPTGVGKTEIARRLADLAHAPFVKVEASKYTEVGYVGRDVEAMVRDLADIAVNMVKQEKSKILQGKAELNSEEKLLDLLLKPPSVKVTSIEEGSGQPAVAAAARTREKLRDKLRNGKLDDREVEIDAPQNQFPVVEVLAPMGMEELGVNFQEIFSGLMPRKNRRRKLSVKDARKYLVNEELNKLIDIDQAVAEAMNLVQESGIIFVDEIDKIVGSGGKSGPDVSREGVQRDILPIVEGCGVMTKYGMVHTDHILFIAAGAFHGSSPSDLIPELQGRFPIRVELDSLTAKDFERILIEPQASLVKQYKALLKTEGVTLEFAPAAIKKIASFAEKVNTQLENIGARRLHTVMTTLLEDILFDPPVKKGKVTITGKKVEETMTRILEDEDLSRYIL